MSTVASPTNVAIAPVIAPPSSETVGRAATVHLLDHGIEIPAIANLSDFCKWAESKSFPERGRIDYIAGRIEVDMSPEDIFCHGTLKTEVVGVLWRPLGRRSGVFASDRTRLSCPEAELSAEPDVLYASAESLDCGRIRLIAKANHEDRYVALEGAADLIVEIISDSSEQKDMVRLPVRYYRSGLTEFWLIDARGEDLLFLIQRRGENGFEPAPTDADGFQFSAVTGCWYKLVRSQGRRGNWEYELIEKRIPEQGESHG